MSLDLVADVVALGLELDAARDELSEARRLVVQLQRELERAREQLALVRSVRAGVNRDTSST